MISKTVEIEHLHFPAVRNGKDIHSIWRFPGSFHAPVCDWIIKKFTKKTDIVLDPMCGSGILPIQSFIHGRVSYGFDIDPFSILMCKAKSTPYDLDILQQEIEIVKKKLLKIRRTKEELEKLSKEDENEIDEQLPNIHSQTHWFKNYVLNDVGEILKVIKNTKQYNLFFRACLGSTIRYISNADPVPISGLEVTSHYKEKNNGRKIDTVGKLIEKIDYTHKVIDDFNRKYKSVNRPIFEVLDIRQIEKSQITPDVIIFSPPYCNAIEYYRRHRLEYMVLNIWDRNRILEESRRFLGNTNVLISEEKEINEALDKLFQVEKVLDTIDSRKKRAVIGKYFMETNNYLKKLQTMFDGQGKIIIVVGDSKSAHQSIPTNNLILNMAINQGYLLENVFEYPIKNKRMNYTRRNDANIKTEKILVLSWKRGDNI